MNGGGIPNIPFVVANANPTRLDAIFRIETVQGPDGGGSRNWSRRAAT